MAARELFVLFVSTGDAARGILAEALLNAKNSALYRARSAGTDPLEEISPATRALLDAAGIETSKLHPKKWQDFYAARQIVPVDVIVTLSEEARMECPFSWTDGPVHVHWAMDDPLAALRADVRDWKLRKCFSILEARIEALMHSRPPASQAELWLRLKDIGMVV